MNRIRKLAAVVKEGVSNPEKIKKGLKVLFLKKDFLIALIMSLDMAGQERLS